MKTILTINGNKFAINDSAFIDSLFEQDGTCEGFFKPMKNHILFYDLQNVPFAALVANKGQNPFFVTAGELDDKIIYMQGISEIDAHKLGIKDMPYKRKMELAKHIAEEWLNEI